MVARAGEVHREGMTASARNLRVITGGPDPLGRVRGLQVLTGNTPLLAVSCEVHGRPQTVYAKAENLNFTGSIKDRMGGHIIRRAYETGELSPGGADRRGDERQHRHLVRCAGTGARASGHDLHAGRAGQRRDEAECNTTG